MVQSLTVLILNNNAASHREQYFCSAPKFTRCHVAAVGNAINMAHDLGLTVVGEGVEARAHYDMLWALGCDIAALV